MKRVGRDARRSLGLLAGLNGETIRPANPALVPESLSAFGDASDGNGNSNDAFTFDFGVVGADGGTRKDVGVRAGSDAAELARDVFSIDDCTAGSAPGDPTGDIASPGLPDKTVAGNGAGSIAPKLGTVEVDEGIALKPRVDGGSLGSRVVATAWLLRFELIPPSCSIKGSGFR